MSREEKRIYSSWRKQQKGPEACVTTVQQVGRARWAQDELRSQVTQDLQNQLKVLDFFFLRRWFLFLFKKKNIYVCVYIYTHTHPQSQLQHVGSFLVVESLTVASGIQFPDQGLYPGGPCIGRSESYPLDCQRHPKALEFKLKSVGIPSCVYLPFFTTHLSLQQRPLDTTGSSTPLAPVIMSCHNRNTTFKPRKAHIGGQ